MALKFFVNGMDALAKKVAKYGSKYQAHLEANLSPEAWTCVQAFISAANAVVICLKDWTPPA